MIQIKQVKKYYPGGKQALGGIDLSLPPRGDRGPLRGERRGQDPPPSMKCILGLLRYTGEDHPGWSSHHPQKQRKTLLRHLRALLFPPT